MERFEILSMRTESIAEVLNLAEEGGLSPWSKADYLAELGRDDSITLEICEILTGKPRGFIIARLITSSNGHIASQAEILNITVDSNYRKLYLGSTLLDKAISIISEYSPATIWLEVRASNKTAISFYETHGFTHEYVRKNFYSGPVEDGLVMKLEV